MASSATDRSQDIGAVWRDLTRAQRLRVRGCVGYLAVLTLLFSAPLAQLASMAFQNNLHSYIPLIPVISVYLLVIQPRTEVTAYSSSIIGTVVMAAIAGASTTAAFFFRSSLSLNDYLSLMMLGYVAFIAADTFMFLGSKWMVAAAFPISFLLFMIPLPDAAVYWLERGLVLASAEASVLLFKLTGTPMWRDGTYIGLPGIVLHVVNECSGIRSTWVLFITSVLASHLLLRNATSRVALVALVLPLGIVRNAVRIVVIGLLCVHIGPPMIDSAIHRRGGPVFFALSLVPLFLATIWLQRRERRRAARTTPSCS